MRDRSFVVRSGGGGGGKIVAEGEPREIVTADLIHDLFGLSARVGVSGPPRHFMAKEAPDAIIAAIRELIAR